MAPINPPIEIRHENPGDGPAIRAVNEQAFPTPAEANVVDALRRRNAFVLSMVAIADDKIVAHILFTHVTITDGQLQFWALGLAPLAVLPHYQRKGIGSKLLTIALDNCRDLGYDIVVVLGHPEFYTKFGFVPAKKYGIKCGLDVPEDLFMVLQLRKNALTGITGTVGYQDEFRIL
jgi:putative acetyltransferase